MILRPQHAVQCFALALLGFGSLTTLAQPPEDGQIRMQQTEPMVWSAELGRWQAAEDWWLAFAKSSDGKFWGKRPDYPRYDEVSEHDTLMISGEHGSCLMYFFHQRWRRAQDVRRWDPAFNEILGCPTVFD